MIDKEKREFGKWWLWVLLLIAVAAMVFFGLRTAGLIGKTVTERIIFEQSFQKKAGDNAKLKIFEGQRSSILTQLDRTDLTQEQRADYQAKLNAIDIQISTVKGN